MPFPGKEARVLRPSPAGQRAQSDSLATPPTLSMANAPFRVSALPRQSGPGYLPPQTIRWYARQQGNLLEVRKVVNHSVVPTDAKRGKIKGFTRSARLRMLRFIATIDWSKVTGSNFITLTYPDHVVNRSYEERTTDRTLFVRYLEEDVGGPIPTLWRVEWIARKSGELKGQIKPHLHIITFKGPPLQQSVVKHFWRKVIKVKGPLSTDVRQGKSPEHAARYASKYAAKETSVGALDNNAYLDTHGRAWGVTRRESIPLCEPRMIREMSSAAISAAMKIAARILDREYVGTFFVLGDAAPILLHEIGDIGDCPIELCD